MNPLAERACFCQALRPLLDRNAQIGAYAQSIGFKVGWIFNNEGFQSAYTRDPASGAWSSNISFTRPANEGGDFGTETAPQFLICPAKGLSYLLDEVWGPCLRRIADNGLHLDHLIAWPYDWGGCGCEHDWPWGSVGFPRFSSAVLAQAKGWGHPDVEGTLSTWHFQMSSAKPPADEYGGLDKWLRANNNRAAAAAALPATAAEAGHTHAHGPGDYEGGYGGLGYSYGTYGRVRQGRSPQPPQPPPGDDEPTRSDQLQPAAPAAVKWTHVMSAVPGGFEWLSTHGPVGGLPTLDFPEYSMFSGCPWGGWGANPIPSGMQRDWDTHGHLITGGMPYSEGIYLDMNQVMRQQQYWGGRPTNATLAEYIRYEFGWGAAVTLVSQAVGVLEADLHDQLHDPQSAAALALLTAAMPTMTAAAKTGWRWRVLYLRARIDALAFNGTESNGAALNASFAELDRIYHVERDCCHPSSPADCTDGVDTQSNCTLLVLRPGLPTAPGLRAECSDERLKRQLRPLGVSAEGVPLFSWRYRPGHGLDSRRLYRGTTAQALLAVGRGDAVVPGGCIVAGGGGFLAVDYAKIPGVPFGVWPGGVGRQ